MKTLKERTERLDKENCQLQCEKLIYQWVRNGDIKCKEMGELSVYVWKKFVY